MRGCVCRLPTFSRPNGPQLPVAATGSRVYPSPLRAVGDSADSEPESRRRRAAGLQAHSATGTQAVTGSGTPSQAGSQGPSRRRSTSSCQ